MLVLLALVPFVTTAVLYWIACSDVFSATPAPANWTARLFLPVLTASLVPLAAAAETDRDSPLLLFSTALGVAFTVILAAAARDINAVHQMKLPIGLGDRRTRIPRWQIVRAIGLAILAFSAGAVISS